MSIRQRRRSAPAVAPTIAQTTAIVAARTEFGSNFTQTPEAKLVVHARTSAPRLAWRCAWSTCAKTALTSWMRRRARSSTAGAISKHRGHRQGPYAVFREVPLGTNSLVSGFELRDPSRGNSRTLDGSNSRTSGQVYKDADNTWGNNAGDRRRQRRRRCAIRAAMTWDYYLARIPAPASRTMDAAPTTACISARVTRTRSGTTRASA